MQSLIHTGLTWSFKNCFGRQDRWWEGEVLSHIKGQSEFLGSANNNRGGTSKNGVWWNQRRRRQEHRKSQQIGLVSLANTKSHTCNEQGDLGLEATWSWVSRPKVKVVPATLHNLAWLLWRTVDIACAEQSRFYLHCTSKWYRVKTWHKENLWDFFIFLILPVNTLILGKVSISHDITEHTHHKKDVSVTATVRTHVTLNPTGVVKRLYSLNSHREDSANELWAMICDPFLSNACGVCSVHNSSLWVLHREMYSEGMGLSFGHQAPHSFFFFFSQIFQLKGGLREIGFI